jgi:hypothetical protein
MNTSSAFTRTIGIDYSGAQTPTASLKRYRPTFDFHDAALGAL